MAEWLAKEEIIRLYAFLALLAGLFLLERLRPIVAAPGLHARQFINLGFSVINSLLLRVCFPLLAVDFALSMSAQSFGLFNVLALPLWLEISIAFLLLEMAIYWQHRALHAIDWLWRLHRVHHCDLYLDVSTALRFHPAEAALSMLFKLTVIALLGAHPLAVLLFELALSSGALFSHANLKLPSWLDLYLRGILVTPNMHRVHHSITPSETNSNFGFFLSLWDRLFKSYIYRPDTEMERITIGLTHYRRSADQQIHALLLNPFVQPPAHDTVNTGR